MIEQINKILAEGESITVEFKTSRFKLNKNAFESICAFLNRNGGHMLLGVADNGNVEGIDENQVDKIHNNLVTPLNNPQKLNPTFYLFPQIVDIGGKKIIYLQIPESSQVHSTSGKIFDRNNDGDFDITKSHQQLEQMYLRKSNTFSETAIYKFLALSDLRSELIAKARKLASIQRPKHPWGSMDDHELLVSAKLFRKDFRSGEEGYTLAAALLFGKDEVIQNILPAYKTDALVRIVNTDRYDDRLEVRTNLIESYELLMDFVAKHLLDPFYLEKDQRISLRDTIFREIISNTLIHREFLSSFPSRLVIERNKTTIENWNKPFGHGLIDPVNFYTHPKNPNILEVFKQIGRADELGSGVRNVFKYGKLYGKADPVFEEGDIFRTIISVPNIASLKASIKGSTDVKATLSAKKGDTVNDTVSDTINDTVNTIITKIIDDAFLNSISENTKKRFSALLIIVFNNPGIKKELLTKKLQVSGITIKRDMQKLRDLVQFKGPQKTGGYYLTPTAKEKISI